MLSKLIFAFVFMALCVGIHATGLTAALRWHPVQGPGRHFLAPWTRRLILLAAWMILLHLLEICAWAAFYAWAGAMPDLQAAVYFSAVTYTTTGYGDLVLPEQWRLVGAVEALTGILMCGWSTGFFFAIVSRISPDGSAGADV